MVVALAVVDFAEHFESLRILDAGEMRTSSLANFHLSSSHEVLPAGILIDLHQVQRLKVLNQN
ncbi:unnamed protein product [Prunus armeniaca]